MTDTIEVFLGDIRCALQRFEPKPGDVFVLTVKGYMTDEQRQRFQSEWKTHVPYDLLIPIIGDPDDELKLELNRAAETTS